MSTRIVIAGASSLLGAELKSLLEESRFAAADFRLVDEELAAGTLTEAAGAAAVIQPVEEDSFDRANIIFFTGSHTFTKTNLALAQRNGPIVVDLSGSLTSDPAVLNWFSNLEILQLTSPITGKKLFAIPSAAATAAASLSLALTKLKAEHLSFVELRPVSESGKRGIEELEQQTSQLLSFQTVGSPVFDTQVGFNHLDRFGPQSKENLGFARERLRAEVASILHASTTLPAIQVVHAPVFYGSTFTVSAKFSTATDSAQLIAAAKSAGFHVMQESAPSNVSAAGESLIQLASPERDSCAQNTWWFWGAADNIRLPAYNAVKLAEKLLP
ncbi:MAG TPA: Asd/ArgC dimerization domain-containing protein [Candidatus Eremiobacteraceae bacterium]|nr:Asd/ArgC dimerization domain-containing protein [Candidatus Eremiobacteraceae bacterium]